MCLEDRPVLEPNAAGIDVGAREMFVAVPAERDENPVRVFTTFTEDLHRLADWLVQCGITTAVMESTGSSAASRCPARMASTIARPVTPVMSLMT